VLPHLGHFTSIVAIFSPAVYFYSVAKQQVYCITDLRTMAGLSQQKLSDLSGVPKTTIHKIKNGTLDPTTEQVALLAKTLGKAPHSLYKLLTKKEDYKNVKGRRKHVKDNN
jgi:transcriptional regulator with XRE-family HTH domain